MKVLVFASGRGSNFDALITASKKHSSPYKIVGLICDKDCPAMEIAANNNVSVSKIDPKNPNELIKTVKSYSPDYIALAGYMRIIPSELVDLYPLKIINIHPSLLPAFTGKDAILQAWNAGIKTTGVSVHYVNDKLDQGPIITQAEVPVPDSMEKLEERMHAVEHKLYIDTLNSLAKDPFDTLLVSRCLLGENCRYDGGNKYSKRVETVIKNFKGRVVEICPEVEAGLGTPRQSITSKDLDVIKKIETASRTFIKEQLSNSKNILAILKDNSPSCATKYPQGVFTSMLVNEFKKHIFIVGEGDI